MFGIYRKLVKTFMKLFCVFHFSCVVFYSEYTSYCCCKKKNKGNGGNNNRSSNGVESTNGNNNGSKKDDKKGGPKKDVKKGWLGIEALKGVSPMVDVSKGVFPMNSAKSIHGSSSADSKIDPEKDPEKGNLKISDDEAKKIMEFRKHFNIPEVDYTDIRILKALKDNCGDMELAFASLFNG